MKQCAVCRIKYRGAGRRVVADGRFRIACPRCAGAAVRVAQTVVSPGCACGGGALLCGACSTRAVDAARADAQAGSLQTLRAYVQAFKRNRPAGTEGPERSYVEGLADGLERAIDVLLGQRP